MQELDGARIDVSATASKRSAAVAFSVMAMLLIGAADAQSDVGWLRVHFL